MSDEFPLMSLGELSKWAREHGLLMSTKWSTHPLKPPFDGCRSYIFKLLGVRDGKGFYGVYHQDKKGTVAGSITWNKKARGYCFFPKTGSSLTWLNLFDLCHLISKMMGKEVLPNMIQSEGKMIE